MEMIEVDEAETNLITTERNSEMPWGSHEKEIINQYGGNFRNSKYYRPYEEDSRSRLHDRERYDQDREYERGRDRSRERDRGRDRVQYCCYDRDNRRDRDRDRIVSRERDWQEELPNNTIMVRGLDVCVTEPENQYGRNFRNSEHYRPYEDNAQERKFGRRDSYGYYEEYKRSRLHDRERYDRDREYERGRDCSRERDRDRVQERCYDRDDRRDRIREEGLRYGLQPKDIALIKDNGIFVNPDHLKNLSAHMMNVYIEKKNTNCLLKVADGQFPVHRCMLAAFSSVFFTMFQHCTAEKHSVVIIPNVKAVILDKFLKYIYAGVIFGMNTETAISLYELADKYAMFHLKEICVHFLKSNITVENFCYVAALAQAHGEIELEESLAYFYRNKMEDILKSNAWKHFLFAKPSLAVKFCHSSGAH